MKGLILKNNVWVCVCVCVCVCARVKFCFLSGKTEAETVTRLKEAFKDEAMRKTPVYE